jgi:glucose-6-phosphate 1-epimerase
MTTIEDLRTKFTRDEAVFFTREHGDLVCANLKTDRGASAVIALYGGHLLSWRTADNTERIFMSSKAIFERGKAIRGGIPIVFPQFGSGAIVSHGFARTTAWEVVGTSLVDGGVAITLSLADSQETRAVWPHKFRLDLTVTLTEKLTTELWIENTDDHPWECTYLFHSYFKVEDIAAVRVAGLSELSFIDKVHNGAVSRESAPTLVVDRFLDRVYRDAPDTLFIDGVREGEEIEIVTHNFSDAVVWNPWSDKTPSFGDLGSLDYRSFVCVEAGNVARAVVVPPGERVVSTQTVTVIPKDN